jgi:hypothetical protein
VIVDHAVAGGIYAEDVKMHVAGAEQKTSKPSLKALTQKFTGIGAEPLWAGVWQWDEFNERIIAVNPPFRLDAEHGDLSEADMARLQLALEASGYTVDDAKLRKALIIAASEARFHPVCEYLDNLEVPVPYPEAFDVSPSWPRVFAVARGGRARVAPRRLPLLRPKASPRGRRRQDGNELAPTSRRERPDVEVSAATDGTPARNACGRPRASPRWPRGCAGAPLPAGRCRPLRRA